VKQGSTRNLNEHNLIRMTSVRSAPGCVGVPWGLFDEGERLGMLPLGLHILRQREPD